MSDVADRVKKIVVEHLGVDDAKVTDNASFIDDLGADSLDTVELVMAFEEEFGCEIPDDAAVERLLWLARDLGINLIDPAPAYGTSQERLGKLLPGPREDWVIVS